MEIKSIPLSLIAPSPMNPRKTFDKEALQELADNIEKQGLLQPVTVRANSDRKKFEVVDGRADFQPEYELICGERRFRAMCILSDKWNEMDIVAPNGESYNRFSEIPAIVREMTDDEAFDAMITENLQRKDVDPIEEAFAFGQLIQKGQTVQEVALRFGKSIRFVQDRCKLNSLIPELMVAVKESRMSISAAMIIAKLNDADQRRYHGAYSNNRQGYTKDTAESFIASIFMSLDKTPWYNTDNQADEDYAGGCGKRCADCEYNTANSGCLFWEMKTEDAGKCTNRELFNKKHVAFILDSIEPYKPELIELGKPLESGRTVIVDTDEWCSPATKSLKAEIYTKIREKGIEVVESDKIFEGKCFYDDERLQKCIKQGKVYKCLRLFFYDNVGVETEWRYFKGRSRNDDSDADEASTQSVDAMNLIAQKKKIIENSVAKIKSGLRSIARDAKVDRKKAELTEIEELALDCIIFSLCGKSVREKYGDKSFSKTSDAGIIETVKQNRADRAMWVREFLRETFSSTDTEYNQYYGTLASKVLELWLPDVTSEMRKKIDESLDKKIKKINGQLEELGYDSQGKLFKKD